MKKIVVLCSFMLALAACGSERKEQRDGATRVGGFLKNAFAREEKPTALTSVVGGGLCGDPLLVGEPAGRVPGKISGCGIEDAVRVTSVAGVRLSQSALVECATAKALRQWVTESAQPTLAKRGGGLSELKVAAHYACRTRNHQRGAKISEHGKGRAIDISAFRLADGTDISVLEGWRSKANSGALRKMHKEACGPFGTVLGPKADRFHQDHFHFDVARYRSGSYCR